MGSLYFGFTSILICLIGFLGYRIDTQFIATRAVIIEKCIPTDPERPS